MPLLNYFGKGIHDISPLLNATRKAYSSYLIIRNALYHSDGVKNTWLVISISNKEWAAHALVIHIR